MRIIAGTHRGRPLTAPRGLATRPTTDRVREALFGVLSRVTDLRVLDCYAGSGALGFEALSRGASHATFIESGKEAAQVIETNASRLQLSERVNLLRAPVEKATRLVGSARWDLVLSDPPWPICQEAALAVLNFVVPRLNPGARVVLGHPARVVLQLPPIEGLELTQTRSWGDSAMSILQYQAPSPVDAT
jgi:16S rRNA (guanine966-N2)-methyltransferase